MFFSKLRLFRQLFKSYSRYTEDRIGEQWGLYFFLVNKSAFSAVIDVLICEMATDGKNCVGHNEMYEHILVPTSTPQSLLGKTVRVVITGVSKFYMTSLIVKNNHRNSMVCTFVFVLIILYILFKFLLNCLWWIFWTINKIIRINEEYNAEILNV